MQVYLYDKETLIYQGEKEAQLDVLSTKYAKKNVYFKPINATFTPVPELKEGETAKYVEKDDNWIVVASNIGKYSLNTITGHVSKITYERGIGSHEVLLSEEQYSKLKENPNKFVVKDGKLKDISGTQEYQNKINIEKYNKLILESKEKYDTFLNTPVKYKDNTYLPRYIDDYEKLQLRAFPQEIWDSTGLNSKVMDKPEFMNLKTFLEELVTKAFKEKKENIKRYKLAIKKLEG